MEERPVRGRRGDDDRRLRDGRRARLRLHPRRVPAGRGADRAARSTPARERGLPRRRLAGLRVRFDIELRRGAGAYICGEETALFKSIEGKRGEPRNKPPFPVEVGLFGKPTAVNNVETLVNVPRDRAATAARAFAAIGTEGSDRTQAVLPVRRTSRGRASTRSPFGTTLRELLELGGGVPGGRADPGDPARRRGRRLRRARRARRAADVRGHARHRRHARLGRRHGLRRDGRPRRRRSAGSPRSSATSRAASASRAASGPSARRSCSPGWRAGRPRGSTRGRSSRCCARSARPCATPRSAASARPRRRAIESALPAAGAGGPVTRARHPIPPRAPPAPSRAAGRPRSPRRRRPEAPPPSS